MASRTEELLAALANGESPDFVPRSRNEALLKQIIENGGTGGGGGGATGWEDLNGKPFTKRTVQKLVQPEVSPVYVESEGLFVLPTAFTLQQGKNYVVTWNGVDYTCLCVAATFSGLPILGLGNIGAVTNGTPTAEPFAIGVLLSQYIEQAGFAVGVIPLDGSTDIRFSVKTAPEEMEKIDPYCLPEGTPYVVEEYKEILPETQLTFDESGAAMIPAMGLVIGSEYNVCWDGVEYSCIAKELTGQLSGVCVGNAGLLGGEAEDVPFLLADTPETSAAIGLGATSATVSVEGMSADLHRIDPRLLPEVESDVFTVRCNSSFPPSGVAELSHTFDEIYAAHSSGKFVRLEMGSSISATHTREYLYIQSSSTGVIVFTSTDVTAIDNASVTIHYLSLRDNNNITAKSYNLSLVAE